MFWTHALGTVFMYTKAQGYLLLLLLPTDKAESAISVDKSEFIISQGSYCIFLVMEVNLEGRVKGTKATEEF